MPRIVHFEIYADDVDRASKFYSDLFGWEISKWDGPPQMDYRLVTTGSEGPGIDGGITKRPHEGVAGVNYVDVESIEEYLGKVQALRRPGLAAQDTHSRSWLHRHMPGYRRQPNRFPPVRPKRVLLTAKPPQPAR